MTSLEREVMEMRQQLAELEERVRLTATAERFIAGDHAVRDGDFVKFDDGHTSKVSINSYNGKWTYRERHRAGSIEAFRVPPEDGIERLYTIAEVAEIVEKARDAQANESATMLPPPSPSPRNPRTIVSSTENHEFEATEVGSGFHSGRPTYRVVCRSCSGMLVHPGTTSEDAGYWLKCHVGANGEVMPW